jgi:hypothetical protein
MIKNEREDTMKLNNRLLKSFMIIFSLALVFGVSMGCKEAEEEVELTSELTPEVAKPEIPPAASLAVDFSEMEGGSTSNIVGINRQLSPDFYAVPILGTYFADAALVVGVWNLVIVLGMAPPITVFHAAASQTAVYEGDRTWAWNISAKPVAFNFWSAKLTGTVSEDATTVAWSMKVSNQTKDANNCCTDFQWFTGQHTIGASSGSWQFYDPTTPDAANTKTLVAWDVTSDTIKSLTFTDNSSADATSDWGNGSYLQYTVSGDSVSFTAKDSSKTDATIIAWDTSADTGRIRYDDGTSEGCWDSSRDDIACTP